MSKLLANQISNYNDNGPVEVKEGVNVPSGKPFQVGGANGTSGQFLKSTGSSVAWETFPTIPAAQVNANWTATSGVAQILNKPTLATVATSGSYSDLNDKPTIPAAQVSSDWTATSGVERILNKPNLFSGSYTDLSNKPTIPSNLGDLANVSSNAPSNNDVLKWNGSNWAPATDATGSTINSINDINDVSISSVQNNQVLKYNSTSARWENQTDATFNDFLSLTDTPSAFTSQAGKFLKVNAGASALEFTDAPAGTTTFTGLTDTPANFTSQGGKWLRVNAGATALEFIAAPSNTTYTQSAVADSANVKLRLTDSQTVNDDILLTAGTNITFSSITAAGFTINHSGSASASVTTDDNAPGSPSDGDLWWKSDEGRLKVYYADANSSQWVDASPPLAASSSSITSTTTNGTNSITTTTSTSGANANAIEIKTDNNTASAIRWRFTPPGHLIPFANAQYDIGNAEYKVRHMFLSDNTVYFEGDFLKVAQHNSGGSAQSASYLIPLAKLKDALNASADYEAFKTAILAITDA